MKCISLWQPWASLIMTGAKTYETRSWPTRYRGPLIICAAKARNPKIKAFIQDYQEELLPILSGTLKPKQHSLEKVSLDNLPLGAALGVVDLMDCITTNSCHLIRAVLPEWNWGDYGPDRYAWVLTNVRQFKEPIPMKGAQGLFEPNRAVLKQAMALLYRDGPWCRKEGGDP